MDLPINATIECTDGPGGHSTAIILNPVSNEITHLVVRESGLLGIARMISIELVTESTPELIRLRCTRDELAQMPPFVTTNYIQSAPGYGSDVMLWPYASLESEIGISHENTPPDELAIHRGSHVNATDGHVGEVEEFLVNPRNNGITHVVLREGHFWNRQDVTIPVTQIDHIEDDIVYLKLNKQQIEALPAIAVQRRSR
ncbi:MAG: PRC-barrel domain-containing protein [Roseiflexaceae bacterium]|nr:PRC-barrel domain-containing protein [Roseiflexaceae bacterium]